MQIECPHCNKRLEIADEQSGKVVNCGNCGGQMQVPALPPEPAAAPPTLSAPSDPESLAGTRSCPYCGEQIQADASKCRHCAAFVKGRTAADVNFSRPRGGGIEHRDRNRDEGGDEPPLAIVTLVLAIVGIMFCFPVSAVSLITGYVAMKQYPNMAQAHRVMNIIGMVIGGLALAATVLVVLFFIIAIAAGG